MKRLVTLLIILMALLACQLPTPEPRNTPPPGTSAPGSSPTPTYTSTPALPSATPLPPLEPAGALASVNQLRIANLPLEFYPETKIEYQVADQTLIRMAMHEGFTLLVSGKDTLSAVVGESFKRLCIMPVPLKIPGNATYLGQQAGQAVFGVSNQPVGLDDKDKPEWSVISALPLENLAPELRCAIARADSNNAFFPKGTLVMLLYDMVSRELAGSIPALYPASTSTILRWNVPLKRPELVTLDSIGKFVRLTINLKSCYLPTASPPTPTRTFTAAATAVPSLVPSLTPLPNTRDKVFDFKADLALWPRISSQEELARYVKQVKENLTQPIAKPTCIVRFLPFAQLDRTQLIYYDYPVCLCGEYPPHKNIAGFVVEKNGFNTMIGIVTQFWSPAGMVYYTTLADLTTSTFSTPEKRSTLTAVNTYMSVYGAYQKNPLDNSAKPTLIETPLIFMLKNNWVKLDEYNTEFAKWENAGYPPPYFETHPAAGELTIIFSTP